jgi:hypothetical protein
MRKESRHTGRADVGKMLYRNSILDSENDSFAGCVVKARMISDLWFAMKEKDNKPLSQFSLSVCLRKR